jgi:hypothetical protein
VPALGWVTLIDLLGWDGCTEIVVFGARRFLRVEETSRRKHARLQPPVVLYAAGWLLYIIGAVVGLILVGVNYLRARRGEGIDRRLDAATIILVAVVGIAGSVCFAVSGSAVR